MFGKRSRRHDKGAAFIEAAIVLPLWLLLFYGSVEAYFLIDTYTQLSQVVREGVNTGALARPDQPLNPLPVQRDQRFQPNQPGDQKYVSCLNNLDAEAGCGGIIIAQRIRLAIQSLRPRVQGGAANATIAIRLLGDPPKRLEVSLAAPYRPLLPIPALLGLFGANPNNVAVHTITVRAAGPYGVVTRP